MLKKFGYFFGMCAYAVGAIGGFGSIGGFGYACYCKAYFIAVCVVALAVMAFPTVKSFYNKLMNQ